MMNNTYNKLKPNMYLNPNWERPLIPLPTPPYAVHICLPPSSPSPTITCPLILILSLFLSLSLSLSLAHSLRSKI